MIVWLVYGENMNPGTPDRLEISFENCEIVSIPIQFVSNFDARKIFEDAKYYGNQGLFSTYKCAKEFLVDIRLPFEFDQEHTHLFDPLTLFERLQWGDVVAFYLVWEQEEKQLVYYVDWNIDKYAL